ncbi:MAG: type II secretion system GspH family protein [Phycisphaerales bacterium]|nr:type II secretion system GspH family protein [Phycisphaerales bacterium]
MSIKQKTRAFTLIELLVVIAIIAVLISILLPALSAAKCEGSKAKCLGNLRSLIQAGHTYANDDLKEILGPVHRVGVCYRGDGYAEYGGGPGTHPGSNWEQDFDPRTRPFNRYFYGGNDLNPNTAPGDQGVFREFLCPGNDFGWQKINAPTPPTHTEVPYFETHGTSYRMNSMPIMGGGLPDRQIGIVGRPITRIPDTGTTVAFMDMRAYQAVGTNGRVFGSFFTDLVGFHCKTNKYNLAYCDGHASTADMGPESFYNSLPDFDITVRGTWGRMDCFPAPSVPDVDQDACQGL